ncbi:MAG: hypothetical protein ACK56F_31615, partial [bacterium]
CMQLLLQRSLFVRLACNALIQAGLSVCDRSLCGQFAQNFATQASGLRSQGRIIIGGWSKNSTSELLL